MIGFCVLRMVIVAFNKKLQRNSYAYARCMEKECFGISVLAWFAARLSMVVMVAWMFCLLYQNSFVSTILALFPVLST